MLKLSRTAAAVCALVVLTSGVARVATKDGMPTPRVRPALTAPTAAPVASPMRPPPWAGAASA